MNLKEFFKHENLDEMQKQTLLKIESRGFGVLWVLLLAALIIESLLGFTPREMAAEWFIFGVLWGLWHLPLNLFFYSPDTSLQSIAAQLVVCVTLGVFFTFAYEKCGKNIWLPVVLHYLNNSMVLVWTGTADISNQIISWTDVAISAIMYGVVFLPFLAAKCYRNNK